MSDNCANHIVCNGKLDTHYGTLCYPCHMFFGKWRDDTGELVKKEMTDCQKCYTKDQTCLFSKKLDKLLCVKCFKKFYNF